MNSKQDERSMQSAHGKGQQLDIFYRPSKAIKERWEINHLPLERELSQSPVVNLGCANCSCVLAGTPVLMADGTVRPIETLVGGEMVRTLTGISRVSAMQQLKLGVTRRIIEMRTGTEEPLFISDEHAMWTLSDGDDGISEWWGVYNFNHYLVEKANGYGVNLTRDARPLRFDMAQTHAHIDGWKQVQPIYHLMHPDTALFHLDIEAGGSYIAGGFVISSHAADHDGVGVQWQGVVSDAAAPACCD